MEDRGVILADGIQRGAQLEAGQDHHAPAIQDRRNHHAGHGVDVEQGQRRDHHLRSALAGRQPLNGLAGVDHQIGVGEHRALGGSGRAAGVLQAGNIRRRQTTRGRRPGKAQDHLPAVNRRPAGG